MMEKIKDFGRKHMIDKIIDGETEIKIGGIMGDIIAWFKKLWNSLIAKIKG